MREDKEILEIKKKAAEYQAQGLYKQALQELQKLLNYPNAVDETIYQKIGELHRKLGNKKEALEYYLKAVEGYKKHDAHSYLIPLYKKILEIEPTRKELLIDLAESYYQRGMITEAAKTLHEYADYVYKKGEIEKAFEIYKKLMQLIPENILLKKEVAELYLLHNLPKEALKIYKDIFEHYKKIGREDKLMEIREKMEEIQIILGEEKIEIEETQEIEKVEREDEEEKEFYSVEDLLKGKGVGFREFIIKPKEEKKEERVEEVQELKEDVSKKELPVEEISKEEFLKEKEEIEPKIKLKKWEQIVEMGDLYLELGEKEEALKEYYTAADGYYKEQDFMNAIRIYKKISDLFPLELQARQKLVQIAQQIKDKNLLVESLLELANCLYERGDKEKAKLWYLQILKRADPNCREARERLMIIAPDLLAKLEKKVEIEEVITKKEEKKEERVKEEVIEEAEIVSETGFIDLGEEIRKELEKEEKFSLKKEEKEIFNHIKESIYTHAEKVDPVYALEVGMAMKELGLFEEAIVNLKKALLGDEKVKKEAYYYLGQIFAEIKKYDMAIENLLNALNIKTGDEEKDRGIYYELGKAYEAINNFREAIKYYKILYEKDPTYKELKEKIIQLANKIKLLDKKDK